MLRHKKEDSRGTNVKKYPLSNDNNNFYRNRLTHWIQHYKGKWLKSQVKSERGLS